MEFTRRIFEIPYRGSGLSGRQFVLLAQRSFLALAPHSTFHFKWPEHMDQLRGPRPVWPCADLVSCIHLFCGMLDCLMAPPESLTARFSPSARPDTVDSD